MHESSAASVGIVGGGLAGLAAAVALAERGLQVEVFESRRQLGGRATSFKLPHSGETIDHCQHVAMGCCTNFADFCQRTDIAGSFINYDRLHFFSPAGKRHDFYGSKWLPAPLHLAPAFMRLGYLTFRDRIGVARAVRKLACSTPSDNEPTIGAWLTSNRQSEQAIKRFWEVVLVSALAESLEHASLAAARKVFVDGFLRSRSSFHIQVPAVPLQELYDRVQAKLDAFGANVHVGATVTRIETCDESGAVALHVDGEPCEYDFVVAALPWRRLAGVLPPQLQSLTDAVKQIHSSPITSLHLWFDCAITDLPHAILVDRVSQWIFARTSQDEGGPGDEHYYQIVMSASRELATRDREDVLHDVMEELRAVFPAANTATLVRWQMVTEQHAVFSVRRGLDEVRPTQRTGNRKVLLAGDWTQTGWPATMEGAVRSGYLAAEAVLEACGKPSPVVVSDLPVSWLSAILGLAP